MISMKMQGMGRLIKKFDRVGEAFLRAREYALASVAKMVRNTAKDQARGRGSSGYSGNPLGWAGLSPVTPALSKNKGVIRSGFLFARKTVTDYGAKQTYDTFIRDSDTKASRLSRQLTKQMRREIRRVGGYKLRKKKMFPLNGQPSKSSPLAKLVGFVRSRIDMAAGRVTIGFYQNQGDGAPDPAIEAKVQAQAEGRFLLGQTTPISAKMRRFLFAIGLGISAREFRMPKRRWFGPVFEMVKAAIPIRFREKFESRFGSTFMGIPVMEAA